MADDEPKRILAVDVLRGVAVLGIFAVNVGSFAMPEAAFNYPWAFGDMRGANFAAWLVTHVVAQGKFITIFSLLFGAGIVLRERADDADESRRFVRRQLALLAIGLAHVLLLWHGDILVSYALIGLLAFPLRHGRSDVLVAAGAIVYLVGTAVIAAMAAQTLFATPAQQAEVTRWAFGPATIAAEVEAFQGPWPAQLAFRARLWLANQTWLLPFYSLPLTGGLMLGGIGLARLGFFAGRWPRRAYVAIAAIGLTIGAALIGAELAMGARSGWEPLRVAYGYENLNTLASLPMALAYAAIVVLLAPRLPAALARPLAAVGRTALSCYLAQTLIGTTLFYGHGLGWFGHVDRAAQLGLTIAVWALLLAIAPLWLHAFRFGPAEWVWRCATEGRWLPLRHANAQFVRG